MSDEPKKRSWARALLRRAVVTFVLYPLSSGPAAWLMMHCGAGLKGAFVYMIIYRPLFVLCGLSEAASEMLDQYVGLWVPIDRYR
jgi:hypothetical protein